MKLFSIRRSPGRRGWRRRGQRLASLLLAVGLSLPASAGSLLIVGGGLRAANTEIFETFIDALGPAGDVVVIAAASAEPVAAAERITSVLVDYGVAASRIALLEVALWDDPTTLSVDESAWRDNAASPEATALLEGAAGVWITGGDQTRLAEALMPQGVDSPALATLRDRLAGSLVVAGTSAGAAIVSGVMITGGDSVAALTATAGRAGVSLASGWGLLPGVLVDQHFSERGRLGRLIAALADSASNAELGVGVDEDTALLVDTDGSAQVLGSGYVTVLDGRSALVRRAFGRLRVEGLELSLLAAGDRLNLPALTIQPAPARAPLAGNEYFDHPAPQGTGLLVPQQSLPTLLGRELLDNQGAAALEHYSFDGAGGGVLFRFRQTLRSSGRWGEGRYSLQRVGLDVLPALFEVKLFPADRPEQKATDD